MAIKATKILRRLLWGIVISIPSFAFGEYDEGSIQSINASSSEAAQKLAKILATRLKGESSQVVFLNIVNCGAPSLVEKNNWCHGFESTLTSRLVKDGIRFLPDAEKDEIRKKITDEQVYQQDSMQVDAQKVAVLGKQKAFKAFVSINITSDSTAQTQISASSVNIEQGVVSVSETVRINYSTGTYTPWTSSLKKYSVIGGGLGLSAMLYSAALNEKQQSNKAYAKYKEATTADEATQYRNETQQHDSKKQVYEYSSLVGIGLAIYGCFLETSTAVSTSYSIDVADVRDAHKYQISLEPVLGNGGEGGLLASITWQLGQ